MIVFDESYLIRGKSYKIDDNITVGNPTLEEILDYGEEKYYALISTLTATPSDYKVYLYDKGLDFETVGEFEFFCSAVRHIAPTESAILFGALDFSAMKIYAETKISGGNGEKELSIGNGSVFINSLAYMLITDFIRKINGVAAYKPEKYANEHAKQYRMEIERSNMKYKKREPFKSVLLPLISAYANCPESRYGYGTAMRLHISQFHDGVKRVIKRVHYDNIMRGLYAGTVSRKDINLDEVNWLA